MRSVKRIVSFLAAVCLLLTAVGFAGCRSSKEGAADTLTIGVSNNTSEINNINTFRKAYLLKNPGAKIEIVRISGSFDNTLVRLINSEDLPDIVQVYDFSAQYWTDAGLYYPISGYMERDGIAEEDYFDSIVSMAKSGTDGAPEVIGALVIDQIRQTMVVTPVPWNDCARAGKRVSGGVPPRGPW